MPKTRYAPDPPPDKTRSFLARYGATVLRGGIAAIPTALFTYQARLDLSPQEVWFISYILAHKWDEDLPYPSLHQDRALGDGQWTGRSWGSSAAWFGLTQRSSPTVPRPRRAGP